MAPNTTQDELITEEKETSLPKLVAPQADITWKLRIVWTPVAFFAYWHLAAIYGIYLSFTSAHWATIFWGAFVLEASLLGVLCGAHRLWSHKSYKAKLPLQIILVVFQTMSGHYSVYNWVRDHRLHHRYSDTDADPHNASRGFFFAHMGWVMVKKHPEIHRRGNSTDLSDITSNPLLMFQKKYWPHLFVLLSLVMPTAIPMYFWSETFKDAWHINILRLALVINFLGLINSAAHTFGSRPYDKGIESRQNTIVSVCTLGEGFHNYHHAFPWDYAAGEFGEWFNFNKTFIDFFAWVGWAYDLKIVDSKIMRQRIIKSGDGSYDWKTGDEVEKTE